MFDIISNDSKRAINNALRHVVDKINAAPVGAELGPCFDEGLRYLDQELPPTPGAENRWHMIAFMLWCGVCEDHIVARDS